MKCEEVKTLLTQEETDRVEEIRRHLDSCQSCRRLSEDLAALKVLSSELKGQAKAPDFFAPAVCSQVSRRARLAYVGLAGLAVTALALCFAYVASLTDFSERQAPAPGSRLAADATVSPTVEATDLLKTEDMRWADEYQTEPSPSTVSVVVRQGRSTQYILEVPATIEVRQTQADNEFYLKNVSH